MTYIRKIATKSLRGIAAVELELEPADGMPFRHLVLTGPNGSGKTTVMSAIAGRLIEDFYGGSASDDVAPTSFILDRLMSDSKEAWVREQTRRTQATVFGRARLEWSTGREDIEASFRAGDIVACYLPARRDLHLERATSITAEARGVWKPTDPLGQDLAQFLLNRRAQRSFARDDHDELTATRLDQWFEHVTRGIGKLLGQESLTLEFDRKTLGFSLVFEEQRVDLLQLAHGHAAALGVFSELLMRIELSREGHQPPRGGVVLIDEPEVHLHLELQERLLPALTEMFPQLQFIVATHSPAVVASLDNALIFDLEARQPRRSEALRGRPYGWIMKRHFGLEEDYDLATTRELRELQALDRLTNPTEEQKQRVAELAERLSSSSHALALEVWNRLLADRLERELTAEGAK